MGRDSALPASLPSVSFSCGRVRANAFQPAAIRSTAPSNSPSSSHSPWGKTMGQLSQKPSTHVASRERLAERVIAFLRRKHPQKMPEAVAAETGVSAHTIRKMEERLSAPSAAVFVALGDAYGAEFLHAVTGWRWLDGAHRAEKLAALEARRARLEEELRALSP